MRCLNALFSIGGTYCAVLLSVFCVLVLTLVLSIVLSMDTVTPTGVGQRKAPCASRVSEKVLLRWKVARREREFPDIPTAAPVRTTADKATYAVDGFFKACKRVLKGMVVIVSGMHWRTDACRLTFDYECSRCLFCDFKARWFDWRLLLGMSLQKAFTGGFHHSCE
jgi:hypothetical protein